MESLFYTVFTITLNRAMFSESKSPSELLGEIHVIEEQGFEELLGLMAPLQQLAGEVVNATTIQNQINNDAVKILENSKKMHNLVLSKISFRDSQSKK